MQCRTLVDLAEHGAESVETGVLKSTLSLYSSPPERYLVANALAVVAVDDRDDMAPSVLSEVDMSGVNGPAFIPSIRLASLRFGQWFRALALGLYLKTSLFAQTVHLLFVDNDTVLVTQNSPQASMPVCWVLYGQLFASLFQLQIRLYGLGLWLLSIDL